MEKAIEDLRSQKVPAFKPTARKYGVKPDTLRRRFKGEQLSAEEYHETRQLLSHPQERMLLNRINTLSDRGIPPTNTMIKSLAFKICQKQPGKNWAYEFVQRHSNELISVFIEGFDLS